MEIHYGRKRKGIKKELDTKINDWLLTIDDEALVKLIEKNVIITGGCIASMLLGEKVNDYDVYFRNKETAKAVAEYYSRKFNEKHIVKTNGAASYEPEVREETITNIKGEEEERIIIFIKSAGVAAEEQDEYSYFETMSEDAAIEFVESMKTDEADKEKYRVSFLSQNAITLTDSLQIVIRFFGEPNQIHDNYDFEHACCYYDYDEKELELPASALECLLSRTLIYRGSLYPVASIFRMKKFLERGWRITAGQQLKIMWQISEIDLSDYQIMREQLTGVDLAYMYQLIEALKSVDTEKINSAYVSTIIDRIFD